MTKPIVKQKLNYRVTVGFVLAGQDVKKPGWAGLGWRRARD
jgi:hypothetical protein